MLGKQRKKVLAFVAVAVVVFAFVFLKILSMEEHFHKLVGYRGFYKNIEWNITFTIRINDFFSKQHVNLFIYNYTQTWKKIGSFSFKLLPRYKAACKNNADLNQVIK